MHAKHILRCRSRIPWQYILQARNLGALTRQTYYIRTLFRNQYPQSLLPLSCPSSKLKVPLYRSFSPLSAPEEVRFNEQGENLDNANDISEESWIKNFRGNGPSTQFGFGTLANLTESSVVSTCGSTVVLTTVATAPLDSTATTDSFLLTVDYRERHHGVGVIPASTRLRRDNAPMPTHEEVLASRAIDRALRPLLLSPDKSCRYKRPQHLHVTASVQACDLWGESADSSTISSLSSLSTTTSGHPVALALNAASAAMLDFLAEPVAAVHLTLLDDGTVVPDAPIFTTSRNDSNQKLHQQQQPSPSPQPIGQLLYAGTRDSVVMMEWTTIPSLSLSSSMSHSLASTSKSIESKSLSSLSCVGLPQRVWQDLLPLAHACIQPVLDRMNDFRLLKQQQALLQQQGQGAVQDDDDYDENQIRKSLGLPPKVDIVDGKLSFEISNDPVTAVDESAVVTEPANEDTEASEEEEDLFLHQVVRFCQDRLGDAALKLFGCTTNNASGRDGAHHHFQGAILEYSSSAVHRGGPLLSKELRGRREQILSSEIATLVQDFVLSQQRQNEKPSPIFRSGKDLEAFSDRVSKLLIQKALATASIRFGCRADGRGSSIGDGWKTMRPIQLQVPALPDSVHGSAFFARGDTKVLCTVTLGAPREGLPRSNPYQPFVNPKAIPEGTPDRVYETLPVGSLRFLRTQEALVSDLNTKRVRASREQTGDSGSLLEFQRAFLQYDFPAYSTGSVPTGSTSHNRRSIGHGKLAERSLLPVLPPPYNFPYAVRMTSEVTDSNGSSSMASVCGVTLALLDAGVPVKHPVAGVSVGLAKDQDKYRLLLDITGTEDHYGAMDFKVAGTKEGVTALQLDVKEPTSLSIVLEALALAQSGRKAILEEMELLMGGSLQPRRSLKVSAPRVEIVRFDPQRKRDLLGPGGVVLRQLEDRYGVSLDLTQEGQCLIFGANHDIVAKAKRTVMELVADVVEGEVYTGTIIETKDFGAIVELLRNKEGLLHVNEMPLLDDGSSPRNHRDGVSGFVRESVRVGQEVEVMCIGVDPVQGSIKLSRKALLRHEGFNK